MFISLVQAHLQQFHRLSVPDWSAESEISYCSQLCTPAVQQTDCSLDHFQPDIDISQKISSFSLTTGPTTHHCDAKTPQHSATTQISTSSLDTKGHGKQLLTATNWGGKQLCGIIPRTATAVQDFVRKETDWSTNASFF